MKFIPVLILSFLLQGCAFLNSASNTKEPIIPTTQSLNIDSSLLEFCTTIPEKSSIPSFDQYLVDYGMLATLYGTCATKQAAGVKLLQKIQGDTK